VQGGVLTLLPARPRVYRFPHAPDSPMHLTPAQRLDWLRLIRSENVGPRTFRMLLRRCGSAGAAIEALPDLARRGGARAVRIFPRDEAQDELEAAAKMNVALVALGEDGYPALLAEIDDAPPLLAVRGNAAVLGEPMIAIVGSRNASAAGARLAEQLAQDLGAAGLVVVSGLARGIDAAAHRASVATGTVAVLAGGHDRIYPPEHAPLVQALIEHGVAVSEMPFSYGPRAGDFPRRNRLISGLPLGVIVVEAAHKSGSLITGRMALEQNREVFAVPGSPLDPRAAGSNALIKHGATMVTEAEDVLAVLRPIIGPATAPIRQGPEGIADDTLAEAAPGGASSPDARARIVALLGPTPVPVDDLIRLSRASSTMVQTTLLELELAGRLKRQQGGRVALLD
jgi:DNA processing protein